MRIRSRSPSQSRQGVSDALGMCRGRPHACEGRARSISEPAKTLMKASVEDEVVEAVNWARKQDRPLEILARGTKRGFGRPTQGEPLDVSAIAGIISYEPEELILTARPGTAVSEIRAALDAKK